MKLSYFAMYISATAVGTAVADPKVCKHTDIAGSPNII
jgi:hypothetical protein